MASTSAIVVIGSINVDLVVRGPRLPSPGETVLGGAFFQAGGGKGANQAVAAARAGRDGVALIAAVGDDAFGHESLARFASDGIDTQYVRTIAGAPSGVALILVDATGENMISVASGANALLLPDNIAALPAAVFADAKVCLVCLESPLPTVEAALRRARDAGTITLLNPAPVTDAAAVMRLLPLVDVLTPNRGEAAALAGLELNDDVSAVAAATRLCESVARACVITLGSRGCLVVERGARPCFVPAFPVAAIDATGAGDAFNGALAVALVEGRPLVEAARFASAAAEVAVTRLGAQPSLPARAEIDVMLAAASRGDPSG